MIKLVILIYNKLNYWIFLQNIRNNVSKGIGVFINKDSRIDAKTIIGDYTLINGKIIIKGAERVAQLHNPVMVKVISSQ
ncbi:hypothetical protein METP3_01555 [Methanosarcinales archaeon]|nr:hypothetical protein METP3_01555 [Methanosarcinales archaeon]